MGASGSVRSRAGYSQRGEADSEEIRQGLRTREARMRRGKRTKREVFVLAPEAAREAGQKPGGQTSAGRLRRLTAHATSCSSVAYRKFEDAGVAVRLGKRKGC